MGSARCRVLNVSASGYHSWRRRPPSPRTQEDALLEQRLQGIHVRTTGQYGAPRIHAELRSEGTLISCKRVTRLVRGSGLTGKGSRRRVRTTDSEHALRVSPNLLARQFDVHHPNQVWASDITSLPTREVWLHLAVTLDLHSRAVIRYAMAAPMHFSLPLAAGQLAASRRDCPPDPLHHCDCGSQFASRIFQEELAHLRASGSMRRKGKCWDTAVVESLFDSLKRELFGDVVIDNRAVTRQAVFAFIEVFHNRQRRHRALGYLTPLEFKQQAAAASLHLRTIETTPSPPADCSLFFTDQECS